jgi:hypothetical protein
VQSSPSDLWMRGFKVKVWRVGSRCISELARPSCHWMVMITSTLVAALPSAALSKPALPLLAGSLLLLSLLLTLLAVIALSLASPAVVLLSLTLA